MNTLVTKILVITALLTFSVYANEGTQEYDQCMENQDACMVKCAEEDDSCMDACERQFQCVFDEQETVEG